MSIESLVPTPFKAGYRRLRSKIKNRRLGWSNRTIFNRIYNDNLWGTHGSERFYSGSGTYSASVDSYVRYVRDFVECCDIRTIVEIGCGDLAIGRTYCDLVDRYVGIDVSSVVVKENIARFSSQKVSFMEGDAASVDLPTSDLCIIRQVFQHLDNDSILKILRRNRKHKYMLITEHLPAPHRLAEPNVDKTPGPDTRLPFNSGVYVELPPFNYRGDNVLSLPVEEPQVGPGELFRTTLVSRESTDRRQAAAY
jgi:hypothetical protein